MALIAEDAADRAGQLLALTEELTGLVERETELIRTRQPLPDGAAASDKQRLVNAYRLEMARIREDKSLIAGAPEPLRDHLKAATARMQSALALHEAALAAVKAVTEGLVQAMAEEIQRLRAGAGYGANGIAAAGGPAPVALNQTA